MTSPARSPSGQQGGRLSSAGRRRADLPAPPANLPTARTLLWRASSREERGCFETAFVFQFPHERISFAETSAQRRKYGPRRGHALPCYHLWGSARLVSAACRPGRGPNGQACCRSSVRPPRSMGGRAGLFLICYISGLPELRVLPLSASFCICWLVQFVAEPLPAGQARDKHRSN
jgi:hypothetical protein